MDVSQGRMLHQPTEMTQSVQQAASKVSSDLAVARGIELLKSELSCRDASVRRLQRDLLVSHQARDSQSAQLDVQGQKLWEAQRQLDESRQEVQRGQHRVQQLSRELQDSTRLTQDLQAQVERLNAERCSMRTAAPQQSSEEEVQEIKGRSWELEAELYATQSQLGRHQDGTQDTCRGADEQIQQLQEEVTRLKVELSCVSQQMAEGGPVPDYTVPQDGTPPLSSGRELSKTRSNRTAALRLGVAIGRRAVWSGWLGVPRARRVLRAHGQGPAARRAAAGADE
ncbi:uncharacterized protein LOC143502693, partial [Brachyhypopomus gauderio]|uniref:uncharacterized protein LOC143502693 n=1 Tax=Brachyhypopomus gauderio TaxID=698409 RepID=UPI004042AB06